MKVKRLCVRVKKKIWGEEEKERENFKKSYKAWVKSDRKSTETENKNEGEELHSVEEVVVRCRVKRGKIWSTHRESKQLVWAQSRNVALFPLSLSFTRCPPNLSEKPHPVYFDVIESVLRQRRSHLTGYYTERRAHLNYTQMKAIYNIPFLIFTIQEQERHYYGVLQCHDRITLLFTCRWRWPSRWRITAVGD